MIAMIGISDIEVKSAVVTEKMARRHVYVMLVESHVVYVMHNNKMYACRANMDHTYTRTLIEDECPQIRFMLTRLARA